MGSPREQIRSPTKSNGASARLHAAFCGLAAGSTPRVALGLAIGAVGMCVTGTLGVPGGMYVGAILFPAIARVAGAPVAELPAWFRHSGRVVLGVVIGAAVTGETVRSILRDAAPVTVMILAMAAFGILVGMLVHRVTRMPVPSALCGSTPGVLAAMVALADDLGADSRVVATMHLVRVISIPIIVPATIGLLFGRHESTATSAVAAGAAGWGQLLALLGIGAVGAVVAMRLRLPSGDMLGALVFSALANPVLLHIPVMPNVFRLFATWVVGVAVGVTMTRKALKDFRPFWAAGVITTLLLIGSGLGMAVLLARMGTLDPITSMLASTPGGADQMVILAAAMGGDAPLVAAVHATRQILLMLTLPVVMRLVLRRAGKRTMTAPVTDGQASLVQSGAEQKGGITLIPFSHTRRNPDRVGARPVRERDRG